MTNKPGYVPGKLSNAQVIGTCRFGHERCSELLHFQDTYEALRSRLEKLAEEYESDSVFMCAKWDPECDVLVARRIRECLGEKSRAGQVLATSPHAPGVVAMTSPSDSAEAADRTIRIAVVETLRIKIAQAEERQREAAVAARSAELALREAREALEGREAIDAPP